MDNRKFIFVTGFFGAPLDETAGRLAADVGAEADPEVYDEIPGVAIRKKTMRLFSRIVFYDYSVRQSTLSARSIARSM